MNGISIDQLNEFVNNNIDAFHQDKVRLVQELNLHRVLLSKNPYLFKAKNIQTASGLIEEILNAFLSSSEEKLFGDFLERLAVFVSQTTCGGMKPEDVPGVDLEFAEDDTYYIVQIKSGPNWGNSSQQKKQEENFRVRVAEIQSQYPTRKVEPVLGICYGKTRTSLLRGYTKIVGQSFWHLISGNERLYTDIIEPLGYRAKEHNDAFLAERTRIINVFTQQSLNEFCDNGIINWERIVRFNSGNIAEMPLDEDVQLPVPKDDV